MDVLLQTGPNLKSRAQTFFVHIYGILRCPTSECMLLKMSGIMKVHCPTLRKMVSPGLK